MELDDQKRKNIQCRIEYIINLIEGQNIPGAMFRLGLLYMLFEEQEQT